MNMTCFLKEELLRREFKICDKNTVMQRENLKSLPKIKRKKKKNQIESKSLQVGEKYHKKLKASFIFIFFDCHCQKINICVSFIVLMYIFNNHYGNIRTTVWTSRGLTTLREIKGGHHCHCKKRDDITHWKCIRRFNFYRSEAPLHELNTQVC